MVSFAGVAVFGVLAGIGIAIGISLLNFIRRAWDRTTRCSGGFTASRAITT